MSQLVLKDVQKTYDTINVIKGINLNIQKGEFCVFVGPSGCGKSTLLRMISGLETISAGTIRIDDQIVNEIPAADRGLAMVFQSYALYPHMSVRQNLSFGLENMHLPKQEIAKKVSEIAKMLQIDTLLDRKPKALSGGQRQRVAIGRAVMREPTIFLFDEPLSNLDAELRVDMRSEIASLHKRLGNTMVYVTHDQVEAMTLADKIAVLRQGEIAQFGAPLEIYNYPENIFVAGFIGSPKMNFLKGKVQNVTVYGFEFCGTSHAPIFLKSTSFMVQNGDQVTLGFRPNHVHVIDPKNADFNVNVRSTEQLGGESFIYTFDEDKTPITLHLSGQTHIQSGTQIGLTLDKTAFHLFSDDSGDSLRRK